VLKAFEIHVNKAQAALFIEAAIAQLETSSKGLVGGTAQAQSASGAQR
jgi:hypothetical protein